MTMVAFERPIRALVLLPVLALGFTVGCVDGGDREPATRGGEVRDSAGIRLVELPGDDASAPHWSYELDGAWMAAARGTGRDAAGERSPQVAPAVEFGALADIGLMADGRVVALDRIAARVTVLDRSGASILATFGRPGGGPGEFDVDGLSALVVTDSSSWVPDLVSQRLTEFRPDGTVLRILPFPAVGEADGGAYLVQWRAHPEGGFAFRRLARDGDRIMHWPERGAAEVVHRFGSLSVPFNTLLPPTPIWDLTGEGSLVTARSDRPTVTLRLPASAGSEFGQPVWIASRSEEGEPLSDADRSLLENLLVATHEGLMGSVRLDAEQRAALLQQVRLPEQRPVLAELTVAPDGLIWLRRAAPIAALGPEALRVGTSTGFGGAKWDVLDQEGFLVARATFPEGFDPRRFTERWIYGIMTDSLGEQTPARVERVRPPDSP